MANIDINSLSPNTAKLNFLGLKWQKELYYDTNWTEGQIPAEIVKSVAVKLPSKYSILILELDFNLKFRFDSATRKPKFEVRIDTGLTNGVVDEPFFKWEKEGSGPQNNLIQNRVMVYMVLTQTITGGHTTNNYKVINWPTWQNNKIVYWPYNFKLNFVYPEYFSGTIKAYLNKAELPTI